LDLNNFVVTCVIIEFKTYTLAQSSTHISQIEHMGYRYIDVMCN